MSQRLMSLGVADIDRIMELEHRAFEPTIQACPETIITRLSLGHQLLGAIDGDQLVGAIGFSTMKLGIDDFSAFPSTFKEYSTQPIPADPDTVCIYSLGILPSARGLFFTRLLIDAAFDFGRTQGMRAVVADGMFPSFAGNDQVRPRPAVRRMIERYVATGEFPSRDDFLGDPVLALYSRLTDCRFVKLLPDFIPEDESSGGWRVLLHREL